MSSTTESPFSLTLKVGPNNDLLTGRADTFEDMLLRIEELQRLATTMRGAPAPAPAASPQAEVARAVDAVVSEIGAEVVGGGAIETKKDKWDNTYTKGNPDAGTCTHGPRIVANKTNKAGRKYKAYVCVNDSPFGDWKAGKCDMAFPA